MQLLLVVLGSSWIPLSSGGLSSPPCLLAGNEGHPFACFLCQAKDKEWWIKTFSQFCNKTANEEEEIVHKLLGDKFKVRLWQPLDVFRS